MKDGPVRAGIIGSQFQADCHAMAIDMIEEDMSVVAVASPTASHARAFADRHKISHVYNDYKDLAKDPEVEGQFRHGPAEILSGDFRAAVFGAAPGNASPRPIARG